MTSVKVKIMRVQVCWNILVKRKKVSSTLPVIANEGTTCTELREGAELRDIADGAAICQQHCQRAATKLGQAQKATELNQAEAPT